MSGDLPEALKRLSVEATPRTDSSVDSIMQIPPVTTAPATASSSKVQSGLLPAKSKKETCAFCREQINGTVVRAPCEHCWDTDWLADLFRAATTDESLFPPRCCQQPFVLKDVQHHLGKELLETFNTIAVESGTANRVYCYRPTCSAFICPATETSTPKLCPACLAQTCGCCKKRTHIGTPCATDDAPILALAEQEGWARCKHLVELTQGCYHITCRCRKQFCYVCAETWKNCTCPQWDEQLLLATRATASRESFQPVVPRLQ
ncbi:hypothetical protein C8Q72DRAFT_367978 [Fomitopsis betulina]|nr:hypothetical protein C8Q72DRAFT_367978 [Fomitopsis betulina]